MELVPDHIAEDIALYRISGRSSVTGFVASTVETRTICNDPAVYGVDYTQKLQIAVTRVLKILNLQKDIDDASCVSVLHILRGGLNFGIRHALHDAYGWNRHHSDFISSQRSHDNANGWYITENRYQKVHVPEAAHIFFGDVVATGVSLEHALLQLVDIAKKQQKILSSITFFTIGGNRAIEVLERVDEACRTFFSEYQGSRIIFFEGIFGVAQEKSPLHISLSGTDLLRSPAILAPEFLASQAEQLSFALERCTIYDAGSRAFHTDEYLEDVRDYWKRVAALAESGITYIQYLRERLPEDPRLSDDVWCVEHNTSDELKKIAVEQCKRLV